ncbi:putative 16S rRNA (cytidine(1402)-2'-O)-methyltransferase [Nitrospira tepida]|uniref:16S rRNA (Cytidine(1402)-2'-O)-methyltransferase n=2 Tax=Nitrospira tepida TaxID=2973512 RepID=A0AA86T5V4_9BACT|nr:putative 16S rRNA (cytidine(1402)-2'-O)-methyltransferase [Nitrospira tepida]
MKVPKVDAVRRNSNRRMSPARGATMTQPINQAPAGAGRLFVVGVPIGHPGDLTFRARRVLRSAGIIASEDPRATQQLLARYRIAVPVTTYFPGNRKEKTAVLLQQLAQGRDVALVTDAGTPAVFDPGAYLVRAAHRAGVSVVAVPGPSILPAALSVAGCEGKRVLFIGRLPPSRAARRSLFRRARTLADTHVVLLEPQEVPRLVREVHGWEGNRRMVILRNLTTASEEICPTTTGRFLRSAVYESAPALVTVVFAGMARRARGMASRLGKRRQGKRMGGVIRPHRRAAV